MKALHDYMAKHGINQAELSRRAKVNESDISRWVSGEREPRLKTLRKVAKNLGLDVAKLL